VKRRAIRRAGGFSLLEVLVTVLIIALGLLGLSKMQAASISNTQIARTRSLMALQAASLASAMHGNPVFWANGGAPASVTATGLVVTDATGILNATVDCSATATAPCTPTQMAAYDFQAWVKGMNTMFPTYTAALQCTTAVGTPIGCVITLQWSEKYVAVNRSTAAAAGATQAATQQFTLYVEP
jgi:type IV pilus assembly protein PilV